MGASADALHASGYMGTESQAGEIFLIGRPQAVPGVRLQTPSLQYGIDPFGQKGNIDRTPSLTGTTIKNE